ncbi:MAG TPA: TMEM165/GDT1 family protein [Aquihabitans sp.]|jgi:putative Ca2+/H+ antiporter (TMEM165/GDT1 family)|nr:TMEM165/GDT1 family protein [Aquihabitans sp.]
MQIDDLVRAFATVFPAELPDKSMVATIVLVTRYRRPGWVWLGVVAAFAVHVVVAVAAGSALTLLPDEVVGVAVAVLFAVGAVLLFRAARTAAADAEAAAGAGGPDVAVERGATVAATVVGSFGLIALAEWGDLTQLATASLAASSGEPVATGVGALAALAAVAAIAAAFGRQLVARVPIHKVNYVGAAVFAALAVWTVVELVV